MWTDAPTGGCHSHPCQLPWRAILTFSKSLQWSKSHSWALVFFYESSQAPWSYHSFLKSYLRQLSCASYLPGELWLWLKKKNHSYLDGPLKGLGFDTFVLKKKEKERKKCQEPDFPHHHFQCTRSFLHCHPLNYTSPKWVWLDWKSSCHPSGTTSLYSKPNTPITIRSRPLSWNTQLLRSWVF